MELPIESHDADDTFLWMQKRGFKPVINCYIGGYIDGFDSKAEYQFMRDSWGEPKVFRLRDQHSMFNVAGLYFREIKNG